MYENHSSAIINKYSGVYDLIEQYQSEVNNVTQRRTDRSATQHNFN